MPRGRKQTQTVRLRERKLADGSSSLYLDVYVGGKRTYEFLHLHLLPDTSAEASAHNRKVRQVAAKLCAERALRIEAGEEAPDKPAPVTWRAYVADYMERRRQDVSASRMVSYHYCERLVERYEPRATFLVGEVTAEWMDGFTSFLHSEAGLRQGTVWQLSSVLRMFVRDMVRQGLLDMSVLMNARRAKTATSKRVYLTVDEVRRLAATPCHLPKVARAFLFSCLTGLRYSDVTALRWGDVTEQDGMTRLIFRQQKTRQQEYLDITPQAEEYMGPRGEAGDQVFPGLIYNYLSAPLRKWARDAGVDKPITFHSARHTFATMMLSLGVDLYTVSKLLGHADIKTTQVYAHIIDEGKREAVRKLPRI